MRTRLAAGALTLLAALACLPAARASEQPALPKVEQGWKIALVAQAPRIVYPTAIVVAPDGTIYLGQDPMDMPGPPTAPIDSIVAIKDGQVHTFAEKLWAVMGLEWVDGTLYVVHAPYLSALRDTDGDGRADQRVDLITGLGPAPPGFNGINDHVASGIRLGMDGFLYISVGDKGIPKGVGRDGATIALKGGGVIRVRPDGSGLEVVSTGERNPLSVALGATDEIFTYGNDDDGKKWPNSLTHHIVGGHYGYPYEFLAAPERCLPVLGGKVGGSGTQGICYNEDGLPGKYRGNLFFCDWGLQTVLRFELEKSGATFKLKPHAPLVTKGDVGDFRPFSLAPSADGAILYLVDWAFDGWCTPGVQTGRLYRLWYEGAGAVKPAARPQTAEVAARIAALDHPARAVRLESQRLLAGQGAPAVAPLVARLKQPKSTIGRLHALWALDAIGTPSARAAIRAALDDLDAEVRLQAARSAGMRRDKAAMPRLIQCLHDRDAAVRREAAIALEKLGERSAGPELMAALGDADAVAGWSVRHAIRALYAWNQDALVASLLDPARCVDALLLTDEAWAAPVVEALRAALAKTPEPALRAHIVANLAGLYRQYPPWSGYWFGTNPLAGDPPRKSLDWNPAGMKGVLAGLAQGLADPDSGVRRAAIAGLLPVGPAAAPVLRAKLGSETDPTNQGAIAQALGAMADAASVPALVALVNNRKRPLEVRAAALDALSPFRDRPAMMARLSAVYDAQAPPALKARALLGVGRAGIVPPHDLVSFLDDQAPEVRGAALWSLATFPRLPADLRPALVARLDDRSDQVRTAAISAVANLRLREAIPKLIALAGDEKHQGNAMRALCVMPDPRALAVYVQALEQRSLELRSASEHALLAIRDLVASPLEAQARSGTLGPAALEAAERVLTRFRPVVDWRVIGPFPRTTAQLFLADPSIDFERPQTGASGASIRWQERKADAETGRVTLDPFKAGAHDRGGFGYDANSSPDLAAFACAQVSTDADRAAILLVGSSGTITVAVNQQVVCTSSHGAGRPYAPDSDRVKINLRKGANRIVVLARQGIGPWSFSVQVSDAAATLFAARPARVSLEERKGYAVSHAGDPARGEALFFDAKGIGCARCHSAGGRGSATVGPDLTGLGLKYDRAELVRSVLEPSARIATGYQPVLLACANGQVATGLVRGETAKDIDLIDADARIIRVLKSEIVERRVSDVSLMPAGAVDTLTPDQFADLVAFLESLKLPPRTARAGR